MKPISQILPKNIFLENPVQIFPCGKRIVIRA